MALRLLWVAALGMGVVLASQLLMDYEALRQTMIDITVSPEELEVYPVVGGLLGSGLVAVVRHLLILATFVAASVVVFVYRPRETAALLFASLLMVGGQIPIASTMLYHHIDKGLPPYGAAFPALILEYVVAVLACLVLLIFPDGRFVPRHSRYLVPVILVAALSVPGGWVLLGRFPTGGLVLLMSVGCMCIAMAALRYRATTSALQRHQLRWFLAAALWFVTAELTVGLVIEPLRVTGSPTGQLAAGFAFEFTLLLGYFGALLGVTLSVVRYRVWDIDLVINRSVVYGGAGAAIGAVFLVAFLTCRSVFEASLGDEQRTWALVIAAGVGVALFQPALGVARGLVDRHLFGIAIDYRAMRGPGRSSHRTVATGSAPSGLGQYTNLTPLGRGGMGQVFRARHPGLGVDVAIKVLSALDTSDEDRRRRFEREAAVIARLRHPNIVTVHDVGEHDGVPYMVMEFVDGDDLERRLRDRERMDLDEALPVLEQVAAALDHAHAQGVIHRDVKPSNIMLQRAGDGAIERVVLADFGIARCSTSATQLTRPGEVIGTIDYISPEQIGAEEIDGRADAYSLGVVAYRMLCGSLPFSGKGSLAMIMAHLMHTPPDPRHHVPELPGEVARVLLRALEKKPEQRYSTATAFVQALREARVNVDSRRPGVTI